MAVLELLARQAPPHAFQELVDSARSADAPPDAVERLDHAKELALSIHSLFVRRHQREAGLQALVETAGDLTLPYDLNALLKLITRRARLLLNVDMSYISFPQPHCQDSYVHTADGQTTALTVGMRVPGKAGIGDSATGEGAPFWTPDYLTDPRIRHSPEIDEVVRAEGLQAILAVPLRHGESTFGVLYAAGRTIRHFTPDEIALMRSLADLGAVAIERTRQLDRVQAEIAELEDTAAQISNRLAESRWVDAMQSQTMDLVLGGGDLHRLAELAGQALHSAVLIRSADGRILAEHGPRQLPPEDVLLKASLDAHTTGKAVRLPDGTWVAALAAGSEDLGTLVALPSEPLSEPAQRLLAHTARTAAVLALMARSTAVAESQFRDAFFDDLLSAPRSQLEPLRERARRLAVDLDRPHVMVVARPEGGSLGRALVWASSYAYRNGGLRSVRNGSITLLLPGSDPGGAARAASEALSPLLDQPVTVSSAGPVTGIAAVQPALQEALRCLDAMSALGCAGATASARELGFLGVLLSDVHDVAAFVDDAIGPVVDYDTKRFTQLVRTLEAYFESGSSPTYAAESLHVHPNTVSRRLERITELLGGDWQKPARALEIQLALRLHRTRQVLLAPRSDHTPPTA